MDGVSNNTATTATTATTAASVNADSVKTVHADQTSVQPETNQVKEEKKQDTDWEALIQRAVDRATNKLGNENKNLRKEIEDLKKANLSEAELKQLELQEKDKELSEREQALKDKENRLLAIKAIKEIGLDDGSDISLSLVDFVMAEDEDAIKGRVKVFDTLVKRFVQAEVDKVFKSNGRIPGKGTVPAVESDAQKNSVAVRIGQNTAKADKAAKSTLDYYTGGKKK